MSDIQYGTIAIPMIEKPESVSREEMDARVAATRYSREMARIEAARVKEEDLQSRIDAATARSVANNQSLNHGGVQRVEVVREQDRSRDIAIVGPGSGQTYYHAQADRVAVKVGGVELSPEQAKAWLADGSITPKQYSDAVTEAMQRYQPGYRHSFR